MLFPDPSCLAENTLSRHLNIGLFDIVRPDWVGIVVLSQKRNIYVDGSVNISQIDEQPVLALIREAQDRILTDFRAERFSSHGFDCIIIPIRSAVKYNVFYFYCKQGGRFYDRDFEWLQVYSKLSYANTLLNNEVAQDRSYIENVFDSTESAILAMDLEGGVVAANNAVASIFGLSKEDCIGNHYLEYIPAGNRASFMDAVARVIETRERQSLEEVLFATQNDERILNLVLSPLINSKNRLAGIVLVGTDLTDRRFMEHEVEQSRQFGLLGEIAAGIAHDVKNPLMNIRGSARIIERAPEATPAQKPLLNIIIHEVDRIDTVIEQMLSFGNLSKTANYTRISINEVLSNCVQIVNRQKNNKVINVVCQFGDNLPCIRADNSAIQQVFLNILLNSVQAIQQDGSIFISTCYLGESRSTEVIIRDNGVGISPQNLKKIFSPYFTTKASGTGLGLFLVKRILEQIHATLSIVSTVGKGTEITLLFPDSEEVLCHVS